MRLVFVVFVAIACRAGDVEFTSELWADIRPIYTQTLDHPFLKGLVDGTRPRSHVHYYLVQDTEYLRVFGRL
jgi:thiaminase/transcriptional activator TenA